MPIPTVDLFTLEEQAILSNSNYNSNSNSRYASVSELPSRAQDSYTDGQDRHSGGLGVGR